MSSDGNTIAVSQYMLDQIVVYDNIEGEWVKRGSSITGPENSRFGLVIAMSDDGQIVAGGGHYWDGAKGIVEVWGWDGSSWVQRGESIKGQIDFDQLGYSIDLSSNGVYMIIGSKDHTNDKRGSAMVLQYYGSDWNQLGFTFVGDFENDSLASMAKAVSISSDGQYIAIGSYVGQYVKAFRWNSWVGQWLNLGQDIHCPDAWFGAAVDISLAENGDLVLAVGSPRSEPGGSIHFYKWEDENNDWSEIDTIVNSDSSKSMGLTISLSADHKTMISSTDTFAVFFDWDGSNWNQRRIPIFQFAGDPYGRTSNTEIFVDMSNDGNKVIVGIPMDSGWLFGDNFGQVNCYEWLQP
jgi:hypothetical protein